MPRINKSIEIATTTIKSLSSMSLNSRLDLKAVLEKKYRDVTITDITSVDDLRAMVLRRPDLVFIGMHYIPDESGKPVWLSDVLQGAGIAHTGSSKGPSVLERNKMRAKQRVADHGHSTSAAVVLRHNEDFTKADIDISYPIFVKPIDGGGGSGINDGSVVTTFEELKAQVRWLFGVRSSDVLLETYLSGREFSVGVIRKRFLKGFHLLPLEIVAPPNEAGLSYLSASVKQADSERTLEVSDPILRKKLNSLALGAFEALGARYYGRIDIRLDENGEPHFLEANLIPSLLREYGNLPKAAKLNMGITHDQLIYKIVELGLSNLVEETSALQKPALETSSGYVLALPSA